jgi:hypothetical protein
MFKHVVVCRILNYDTQNEPPYLASTFEQMMLNNNVFCLSMLSGLFINDIAP